MDSLKLLEGGHVPKPNAYTVGNSEVFQRYFIKVTDIHSHNERCYTDFILNIYYGYQTFCTVPAVFLF